LPLSVSVSIEIWRIKQPMVDLVDPQSQIDVSLPGTILKSKSAAKMTPPALGIRILQRFHMEGD